MNLPTLLLATVTTLSASGILSAEVNVRHADLKITLPDRPTKDVKNIGGEDGTEPSRQHRLIINKPNGSIIVWYQDSPGITDAEPVLQAARDLIVRLAGGEVSDEKQLTKQKHPGRYFVVSIPEKDGEFRVAYYFAYGRSYQIMAVGTKDFTRSEATNTMFKSVEFEKATPEAK
jgi:hypothetical protein